MTKFNITKTALLLLIPILGCQEEERFKITSNDTEPPQNPIFVDSEALYGGSRVYYMLPSDEDVLYIEADYYNSAGNQLQAIGSYFANHIDIYGFLEAGEHTITLKSVDRAGNKSSGVNAVVYSDVAPLSSVAASIEILPSFGGYMARWQNPSFTPLYISLRTEYSKNGKKQDFTSVFATSQTETRMVENLDLREGETVSVTATIWDKYGNTIVLPVSPIVLLVDDPLDKSLWTLPDPGTVIGGATQANGNIERGDMLYLFDGITEGNGEINYYQTNATAPWNIIVDLGQKCRVSRVLTHQRYSGDGTITVNNVQGAYYRGNNVFAYNIYIWDESTSSWVFIRRHDILIPTVKDVNEYKTLGDAGDEAFLYPEEPGFSPETRYFRLEALNGSVISELTVFGEPAE